MTKPLVRRLNSDDIEIWKQIRGEALLSAPTSFGQSYRGFLKQGDDYQRDMLRNNFLVASFIDNTVVGCGGWHPIDYPTESHRGRVFGFFVGEVARGKGHGDAIIAYLAINAKKKVIQLELDVVADNLHALALYRRNGFRKTGEVPRALCHDGKYFDEVQMVRALDT